MQKKNMTVKWLWLAAVLLLTGLVSAVLAQDTVPTNIPAALQDATTDSNAAAIAALIKAQPSTWKVYFTDASLITLWLGILGRLWSGLLSEGGLRGMYRSLLYGNTKTTLTGNIASVFLIVGFAATLLFSSGCGLWQKPVLEPGGAYSGQLIVLSTNTDGLITTNVVNLAAADPALALVDQTYRLAYTTIVNACAFEQDNRAEIASLSPSVGASIEAALKKIKPTVNAIDYKWAVARKAYKSLPNSAGLNALKSIAGELLTQQASVLVELAPAYDVMATPTKVP